MIGTSSGYTVESVSSGKFMDLGGSSTVDGTPIVIWQGTGNDNQVWEFKKVGPRKFMLSTCYLRRSTRFDTCHSCHLDGQGFGENTIRM